MSKETQVPEFNPATVIYSPMLGEKAQARTKKEIIAGTRALGLTFVEDEDGALSAVVKKNEAGEATAIIHWDEQGRVCREDFMGGMIDGQKVDRFTNTWLFNGRGVATRLTQTIVKDGQESIYRTITAARWRRMPKKEPTA